MIEYRADWKRAEEQSAARLKAAIEAASGPVSGCGMPAIITPSHGEPRAALGDDAGLLPGLFPKPVAYF